MTSIQDGNRLVLAAVDVVAAESGLSPGMTLAQARAMVPGLTVCPADPTGDAAALRRLAGWCLRYAPLTAPDAVEGGRSGGGSASGGSASGGAPGGIWPSGVWIDVTGTAHLFGGEARLLRDLLGRLAEQGLTARAAIADTPGAAWAMARWGTPAASEEVAQTPPPPLRGRAGVGGVAAPTVGSPPSPQPSPTRGEGAGLRGPVCPTLPPPPSRGRIVITPPSRQPVPSRHPIPPRPFPIPPLDAIIVPPGAQTIALAPLPIDALRLPRALIDSLRVLGFEQIRDLTAAPRAPLVRRFGPLLATRLDQAHGAVFEPIIPLVPPDLIQARLAFPEPLLTAEAFSAVIARLTREVCGALEQAGQGARRLDLLFERVDGAIPVLRVGTARASRDPRHLARMLDERLERIDPGLGVEAMRLIVLQADPLAQAQTVMPDTGRDAAQQDLGPLVDRLANRLGAASVYRAEAVESDVPERSARRVPPLSPKPRTTWPADLPRPVRLLDPPQPIEAMALLPDHPPIAFTWRRVRHRVRHADGPERIAGEWWKRDGEMRSVRDYFRVEDEEGRRFWLFRRGDGADPDTGDRRWFLHGFF